MPPPTWRDLGRRAQAIGLTIEHKGHEVTLAEPNEALIDLASWFGHRRDGVLLRAMVAAALEQLEQLERPERRRRTR